MKPIVAIVGRPNVGKSTLFNRITRTRNAIVSNLPGVTRDRLYGDACWNDVEFTVVDTGGFADGELDSFAAQVKPQILQAIEHADVIVLVLDAKSGLSPFDRDMLDMLRPVEKPVFTVANKIDGEGQEYRLHDFYALGIAEVFPVSAEHGYGIHDFLDALTAVLPAAGPAADDSCINVAVVGRPNAGKSSLVNRLLGEERLVVSDIPGTTRDAVDVLCRTGNAAYRFVDTAGIRRKGRVRHHVEKFSIIKALHSLNRCDVALVVMDALEGVRDQDLTVAGYAHERGCGCILLMNKWDLVRADERTAKARRHELKHAAGFLAFAPRLSVSALTGQHLGKIFPLIDNVYQQYSTRIGTGEFNRILEDAVASREPPLHRGRRIKLYYGTQIRNKPPTFVCFANYPEAIHFSYRRYLANAIRRSTGLDKCPVKLIFRHRGREKKR